MNIDGKNIFSDQVSVEDFLWETQSQMGKPVLIYLEKDLKDLLDLIKNCKDELWSNDL